MMAYIFFFFFQAEDGIRDKLVTGVQTCALPISVRRARRPRRLLSGPRPAARNRSSGPDRPSPRRPSSCDGRGANRPAALRARTWSVPRIPVPGVSPVLRYRQAPSRPAAGDPRVPGARGPGMSPIDAAIIRRKLQRIAASLDGLRPVARLSLEEYRARFYERKAAERLLQEAIEAALDVNAHLIAELGGEVPEEYYGGFLKVGQLGVLPVDLAGALAPSAGLRNRLVHEYETIDDAKVLASVGVLLHLYPRYIQAVESHLTKAGL